MYIILYNILTLYDEKDLRCEMFGSREEVEKRYKGLTKDVYNGKVDKNIKVYQIKQVYMGGIV